MANYVYIAASLDGFIADENGGLDWLYETPNPENDDYGYADFMKNIDAVVMGRKTYEKVLTFGDWVYDKPVFILSNSLKEAPANLVGKAEIIKGELKNVVEELNQKGYKNLYIDGGKTIQSFLQADLVDELIITRVPVILGGGVSLFGELASPIKLQHKKTEVFNNTLVQSWYVRV